MKWFQLQMIQIICPWPMNMERAHPVQRDAIGFFKIIKERDIYTKELFFAPKLFWKGGLEHSVGYQMSVIKFEFISKTELLFLTSNNGSGYFDGKLVKYFQ